MIVKLFDENKGTYTYIDDVIKVSQIKDVAIHLDEDEEEGLYDVKICNLCYENKTTKEIINYDKLWTICKKDRINYELKKQLHVVNLYDELYVKPIDNYKGEDVYTVHIIELQFKHNKETKRYAVLKSKLVFLLNDKGEIIDKI